MLYLVINNEKHYIDPILVEKYCLSAGEYTPFTRLRIEEDKPDATDKHEPSGDGALSEVDRDGEEAGEGRELQDDVVESD